MFQIGTDIGGDDGKIATAIVLKQIACGRNPVDEGIGSAAYKDIKITIFIEIRDADNGLIFKKRGKPGGFPVISMTVVEIEPILQLLRITAVFVTPAGY